jgi:hypothetical protein
MGGGNINFKKRRFAQIMKDNKYAGMKGPQIEDKLQAFSLHAHTVVDFNKWLIAGSGTISDREGLSVSVTELLYELLENWSRNNNTLFQWTHAEWKDFGNVIFIHAYYEPTEIMIHIGMNEEGIYLQMTVKLPEGYSVMQSDNFKKYLKQLSHLGDFEFGEDHEELCIMWPYSCYSVTEVLANGSIAFEIMYDLGREFKFDYNTIS